MNHDQLLADYLESLRVRHYSAHTVYCRQGCLRRFFKHLEKSGVADLREVTRRTLEDYGRQLLGQVASSTARLHLECLGHFFEHLENIDVILLNPAAHLTKPRKEKRLPRHILKPFEVRKMLAAPDTGTPTGIRDRAMLELLYSSGLRREEMGRLTLSDLDIKNGFVRVTRGKGGKGRVVPLGQSACQALARYLKEARSLWLKIQWHPAPTNAPWLSAIQPHQPIEITALAQIIKRYAVRVPVKHASPHVWRHTCATHLVASGANVVYVQRLLGHKSLTTTQIYTRVSVADLKQTLHRAHPRTRKKTAAAPALTPEAAAHMHSGHKQAHPQP